MEGFPSHPGFQFESGPRFGWKWGWPPFFKSSRNTPRQDEKSVVKMHCLRLHRLNHKKNIWSNVNHGLTNHGLWTRGGTPLIVTIWYLNGNPQLNILGAYSSRVDIINNPSQIWTEQSVRLFGDRFLIHSPSLSSFIIILVRWLWDRECIR